MREENPLGTPHSGVHDCMQIERCGVDTHSKHVDQMVVHPYALPVLMVVFSATDGGWAVVLSRDGKGYCIGLFPASPPPSLENDRSDAAPVAVENKATHDLAHHGIPLPSEVANQEIWPLLLKKKSRYKQENGHFQDFLCGEGDDDSDAAVLVWHC